MLHYNGIPKFDGGFGPDRVVENALLKRSVVRCTGLSVRKSPSGEGLTGWDTAVSGRGCVDRGIDASLRHQAIDLPFQRFEMNRRRGVVSAQEAARLAWAPEPRSVCAGQRVPPSSISSKPSCPRSSCGSAITSSTGKRHPGASFPMAQRELSRTTPGCGECRRTLP